MKKLDKMLAEYNDLKREIKMWEDKVKQVEEEQAKICTAVVKSSTSDFPYTMSNVHIEGLENEFRKKKNKRLEYCRRKFLQAKDNCETKLVEIQDFIMSIDDSYTRQIFIYRYIDEMNWIQIGYRMKITSDCARKIHKRFLEKIEKN